MKASEYRALRAKEGTSRKLHNNPHEYGGVRYDSQLEANYAWELDVRVKAGDLLAWERQVPLPLLVNDVLIATYRIDFVEHLPDGTSVYTEVKGHETDVWKLKWKLFKALYPDLHTQIIRKD